MWKSLLIFFLLISLSGCVRTYRMERASHLDSRMHLDGSTSALHHEEGAEREWLGVWPFSPRHIQP